MHDCTTNPRPNVRHTPDLPLHAFSGKPRPAVKRFYPALIIYPAMGAALGWVWYLVITGLYDLIVG